LFLRCRSERSDFQPFLFLVGFVWPTEAIPVAIQYLALLVPGTSAINALVNAGPLGASIPDIRVQFLTLWTLAGLRGCLAVLRN
jgi:ABC-2 type transport system permease protein